MFSLGSSQCSTSSWFMEGTRLNWLRYSRRSLCTTGTSFLVIGLRPWVFGVWQRWQGSHIKGRLFLFKVGGRQGRFKDFRLLTSGRRYNFMVRCIVMFLLRWENFTSISLRGFKERCQYLRKETWSAAEHWQEGRAHVGVRVRHTCKCQPV